MAISINGTSGISGVDGSAATPAIQGTDTNTGISFGTDEVNINTGGNTAVTVDSSQRVGIGTSSPAYTLEVNAGTTDTVASFNSSDANAWIQIRDNSTTDTAVMVGAVGDDMRLRAGSNERVRITSTGDLRFNSGYGSVATAYGVRAWVNFNGSGTVSIRGSGNVSSITDNGTGNYTVNFTTAMPDANYATTSINDTPTYVSDGLIGINTATASSVQIRSTYIYGTTRGSYDQDQVNVAIFR